MPTSMRTVQEKLDEQTALIEKAQKRIDELELAEARRIQRIARKVGLFEVELSDARIEKILIQAMENFQASSNTDDDSSEKQRRQCRAFQQNRARVDRAKRTINRLRKEERRKDTSQKWQLGNLLVLANMESISLPDLEKKLQRIRHQLSKPATKETIKTQSKWKTLGSKHFNQQQKSLAKSESGYNASSIESPDKAEAHRKITLGGLVKKHQLESVSPALLLGALLDR